MTILIYDLVGKDATRPFSPHCWKTKMTLDHLGLAWETRPTRFTEVAGIEGGGYGSVPTIRDGDLVMADSFNIAQHYGKGHALIGGTGSDATIKFVESWSQSQLHSWIAGWAMLDIHNLLDAEDQVFFRNKREKLVGKTLEEFTANRENSVDELVRRLVPMKMALGHNKFIGGDDANFADYIVFGAFQWLRLVSGLKMIPQDHPVIDWMNRCLDLHGGLGRSISEGGSD